MKLSLTLPTDTSIALRKLANELEVDLEEAAATGLREYLSSLGLLELPELDEDTETEGNA